MARDASVTQEEEEEAATEKKEVFFCACISMVIYKIKIVISVVKDYQNELGTNIECTEQPDGGHDFHESEIQDSRRTYPTMQVYRPNIQHYIQCSFPCVLSMLRERVSV